MMCIHQRDVYVLEALSSSSNSFQPKAFHKTEHWNLHCASVLGMLRQNIPRHRNAQGLAGYQMGISFTLLILTQLRFRESFQYHQSCAPWLVLMPVFICSVQTQLNQYYLWGKPDDLPLSVQ